MIMDPVQEDLYHRLDPDPRPEPVADAAPPVDVPKGPGRKPNPDPTPKQLADRERKARRKAANQAETRPAPEVGADKAGQSPAEQVVYTLSNLTEEQRKCRELTLGMLAHGWASGTARLLGAPLVRPAESVTGSLVGTQDRRDFDELVRARPDVGSAATAWDAWLASFDAVAIKRGWYREVPAEWMLGAATVGLMTTAAAVWFGNQRQAAAHAQAEQDAETRRQAETQAAQDAAAQEAAARGVAG